jgi:hypothetical protein
MPKPAPYNYSQQPRPAPFIAPPPPPTIQSKPNGKFFYVFNRNYKINKNIS